MSWLGGRTAWVHRIDSGSCLAGSKRACRTPIMLRTQSRNALSRGTGFQLDVPFAIYPPKELFQKSPQNGTAANRSGAYLGKDHTAFSCWEQGDAFDTLSASKVSVKVTPSTFHMWLLSFGLLTHQHLSTNLVGKMRLLDPLLLSKSD